MGKEETMSMKTPEEVMQEFFGTNSYDTEADWRLTPETATDPDDDGGARSSVAPILKRKSLLSSVTRVARLFTGKGN